MSTLTALKKRIYLGSLLPLLLFFAASIIIFLQARALQVTTDLVRDAQQINILAQEMQARFQEEGSATRGFILAPQAMIRAAVEVARVEYRESRQGLEPLVREGDQRRALRQIDGIYRSLRDHNERLLALAETRERHDEIDAAGTLRASALNIALEEALNRFIADERTNLGLQVGRQSAEIERMAFLVGGATALAIIISLIAGSLVAARITQAIEDVIGIAHDARLSEHTSNPNSAFGARPSVPTIDQRVVSQ